MVVAAIETSSPHGGVALVDGETVIAEVSALSRKTYSKRLLRSISYVLEESGLGWQDLDSVAVGLGPGSFTGLRIGLATAKGLCRATGASLVGIPTLDILAYQGVLSSEALICPVIDARRSQLYCAIYQCESGSLDRISDYMMLYPQELPEKIPPGAEVLFLGSGLSAYGELLESFLGKRARFAPECFWYPRPALCGVLAGKRLSAGMAPDDPLTLVPLYIRPSDAEEKKRAREKAA